MPDQNARSNASESAPERWTPLCHDTARAAARCAWLRRRSSSFTTQIISAQTRLAVDAGKVLQARLARRLAR
jgi:hypothetical protein